MLSLIAALPASEEVSTEGHWITAPPEVVGVAVFAVFMLLLFIVTRFNLDR